MQLIGFGILLIMCSCPIEAAQQGGRDGVFDYLMLVREWPFTFCTVDSCKNKNLLQSKFNIHGLWGEYVNLAFKPEPEHCNTTYNPSELAPIRAQLEQNWMDLTNPKRSPSHFWAEEFLKHGSCVATDARYNSTFFYFRTALQLHLKYNLLDMLAKGNVAPGSTKINASNIRTALSKSFGFQADVRCYDKEGVAYLYELRLCFTKDLAPRDCDVSQKQKEKQRKQRQLEQQDLLRDFPWILQRLYHAAARLMRRILPPSGFARRRFERESGTYACREGEMVLLPAGI